MRFDRKNKSKLRTWWWTIDRLTLGTLLCIICVGAIMVTTASPMVAERIGLGSFYFVKRQIIYLLLSTILMVSLSSLSPTSVKRIAIGGFLFFFLLMIAVLFVGPSIKGAKRWIYIANISVQPSEFLKPFFAIITGWVLSKGKNIATFPSFKTSFFLYGLVMLFLILQPDIGMALTFTSIWAGEIFLAGLSFLWIAIALILLIIGGSAAYIFLPHVAQRVNSFVDPEAGDNYQVQKSLEAFLHGGITGVGPGEGVVKQSLPDSHTDFIFAVMGEELGLFSCLAVIGLFGCVVLRGLWRISKEKDLFIVFSVAGLLIQFGMQSVINMGVSLHLLPTKGMTLPFVSYGGSSVLSIALAMGLMLALTRKRYGSSLKGKN